MRRAGGEPISAQCEVRGVFATLSLPPRVLKSAVLLASSDAMRPIVMHGGRRARVRQPRRCHRLPEQRWARGRMDQNAAKAGRSPPSSDQTPWRIAEQVLVNACRPAPCRRPTQAAGAAFNAAATASCSEVVGRPINPRKVWLSSNRLPPREDAEHCASTWANGAGKPICTSAAA